MDALDERVLRDDEPAVELRRVVLDRLRRARAARARPAARARRAPRAASIAAARRAGVAAPDTATPAAPARMQSPALTASIPPIAITGVEVAPQISWRPCSPSGGPASSFDTVAQTGPTPM